jgi:hypothetical protein
LKIPIIPFGFSFKKHEKRPCVNLSNVWCHQPGDYSV